MKWGLSIWLSLFLPAAVSGLVIAVGSFWLLGSFSAAALVVAACLITAAGIAVLIKRNARNAAAQLRRPELRGMLQYATGIFYPVLQESLELIEDLERNFQGCTLRKTKLEAQAHVHQQKTRQLESALERFEHAVLITDPRDRVQFCNPAAAGLLQSASGNNSDDSSVHDLDFSRFPALSRLLEETKTRRAATDHRTAEIDLEIGGRRVPFRAVATNILNTDGTLIGLVTTLHDISDEQVEKTRHAEFVSSVCHELKTPMASIKAFTELLIDGDVSEPNEQQKLFEFIELQVDRLTRLVNNMLNLARVESGVIKVQREDCELNDVLNQALDVVQPTAAEKKIHVYPELSELYLAVHIDKDLFGQAIINLLSNAIKYTPEGGDVHLKSRMDEDGAVIEVRDNGMGIPEDSLPRIFDRFYRVPENNKAAAGTGLGLALVNYVVTELHNGTVSVTSAIDEGTCFTLRIPLGHLDPSRINSEPAACAT